MLWSSGGGGGGYIDESVVEGCTNYTSELSTSTRRCEKGSRYHSESMNRVLGDSGSPDTAIAVSADMISLLANVEEVAGTWGSAFRSMHGKLTIAVVPEVVTDAHAWVKRLRLGDLAAHGRLCR